MGAVLPERLHGTPKQECVDQVHRSEDHHLPADAARHDRGQADQHDARFPQYAQLDDRNVYRWIPRHPEIAHSEHDDQPGKKLDEKGFGGHRGHAEEFEQQNGIEMQTPARPAN